jgi:AraC-like DNA-binding protein
MASLRTALSPDASQACTNATERTPAAKPRGVLDLPAGVETGRVAPPADLIGFVEHFWWVRWDVTETRVSEVLSYPCVHVVFERLEAHVVGVVRAKFVRKLEGRGQVFAVKFRPGMFRAFCGTPVVRLTDHELPLGDEFGVDPAVLAKQLLESSSEPDRAELLGRTLRAAAPAEDPKALLARDLVQRVGDDRELRSVAALSAVSGLSERQLQRLFRDYVGVSPKWVVRRSAARGRGVARHGQAKHRRAGGRARLLRPAAFRA